MFFVDIYFVHVSKNACPLLVIAKLHLQKVEFHGREISQHLYWTSLVGMSFQQQLAIEKLHPKDCFG